MTIEHSYRIYLPRTGQVLSPATGDDGYFRAGNPRATRFVDNGNGTVSDRATGLMLVKQPELIIPGAVGVHASNQIQRVGPNYGSGVGVWVTASAYLAADLVTAGGLFYVCAVAHTSGDFATDLAAGKWRQTIWTASAANLTTPATFTWANAVACCLGTKWNPATGLNYAGYTDWRLPNVKELAMMPDFSIASLATWPATFTNGKNADYWSSTTCAGNPSTAFKVSFSATSLDLGGANVKTTSNYYVRPVRGGRLNANG